MFLNKKYYTSNYKLMSWSTIEIRVINQMFRLVEYNKAYEYYFKNLNVIYYRINYGHFIL